MARTHVHTSAHLLAVLAIVGCGGAEQASAERPAAPAHATHPTSRTADATSGAAASPSASGTASPLAPAPASAQALPADAPPDEAALAGRLREKDAISRVRAHAVDEGCLRDMESLPEAARHAMTSTINLYDFAEGARHASFAVTSDDSANSLIDMRAFVAAFPKDGPLLTVSRGTYFDAPVWRALCLKREPLLRGGVDLGRVVHADGTYDEDAFRVGLADAAVAKVRKLPPEVSRVAFVLDADVLLVLDAAALQKLDHPSITLAKWAPK